jgi:hypothetical protein
MVLFEVELFTLSGEEKRLAFFNFGHVITLKSYKSTRLSPELDLQRKEFAQKSILAKPRKPCYLLIIGQQHKVWRYHLSIAKIYQDP